MRVQNYITCYGGWLWVTSHMLVCEVIQVRLFYEYKIILKSG